MVERHSDGFEDGLEKGAGEQHGAEQALGGLAAVDQARLTLPLERPRQASAQAGGLQSQGRRKADKLLEMFT